MKTIAKSKAKTKKAKVTKISEQEILIVKVGTDERPAGPDDLLQVQMALSQTANDPNLILVTHHAIDFSVVKRRYFKNVKPVVKSTVPVSTPQIHVDWAGSPSPTPTSDPYPEDTTSSQNNVVYGINNQENHGS